MISKLVLIHPANNDVLGMVEKFLLDNNGTISAGSMVINTIPFSENIYVTVCTIASPYVIETHFAVIDFDKQVLRALHDPSQIMGMDAVKIDQYRTLSGLFSCIKSSKILVHGTIKHFDITDGDFIKFLDDLIYWVYVCTCPMKYDDSPRLRLTSECYGKWYQFNVPDKSIRSADITPEGNSLMVCVDGIRHNPQAVVTFKQLTGIDIGGRDTVLLEDFKQFTLLAYMAIMGKHYQP